jgi:hypothetical protein
VTWALAAGLVLALASAGVLNWSYFAQHGAASALPPLSPRRPVRSLRLLASSGRWLAGFVLGIGGWVLYVAALALAPLSLVQATSAGGIGLLALLVSRTSGIALAARERVGVAVALAGLALLGLSLAGQSGSGARGSPAAVAAWVAVSALAAALAAASGRALTPGAGFGLAAGVLYAAGDVATKAAVAGGAAVAFVAVLLACHGLAFVNLQLGFQRGGALATAGVASLLTNSLPIAAGSALFGEGLPAGALGAARLAAFAAVVAGAAALATTRAGPTGPAESAATRDGGRPGRRGESRPGARSRGTAASTPGRTSA